MTLLALPQSSIWVTLTTSRKTSPSTSTSSGSSSSTPRSPSSASLIALTPSHGRAECAERPSKTTRALMFPRQPSCSVLSVGSRQITSADSSIIGAASNRPGSGFTSGPSSSRGKKSSPRSYASSASLGPGGQLDHHREPALHVGRAEAVNRTVLDPPRDVPLSGNGVRVPGEQDERLPAAPRVDQRLAVVVDERQADARLHVLVELRLVARRRGDVDQRERALGEGGSDVLCGHNAR